MRRHLNFILSKFVPREDLANISNSYDIVGDIAIIRLTNTSRKYSQVIAESIMKINKNIKTVLGQTSPVHGDFRLRQLEFIAGEDETTTIHTESGCHFSVDVKECYFSPRLSYERMRIAEQVQSGEVIVNMFAGVGCFSIVIAKHSKVGKVYSIDLNPTAIRYMKQNVRSNNVYGQVTPVLGDAGEIIQKRLCNAANRILMPLPERAFEYLPYALSALRSIGGCVHYHEFCYAGKNKNPVHEVKLKVARRLEDLNVASEIYFGRVVRSTGPNWYQVVLDIMIKQ